MGRKKKHFVKETACLNCGSVLHGKFCSQCGQKAFLNKENFFHLAFEFISDYFHYDGKFIHTIKALISHPGKITREYIQGKRKTYLNPVQMYIFVSTLFFIFFYSYVSSKKTSEIVPFDNIVEMRNRLEEKKKSIALEYDTTKEVKTVWQLDEFGFLVNERFYTIREYDSIQKLLPPKKRDSYLVSVFNKKLLSINERVIDPRDVGWMYSNTLFKTIPKVFFILLPLFALVLLLFFRKYPYADHIIFSLHFHTIAFVFVFIFLLIGNYIDNADTFLFFGALGSLLIYLYLSMKYTYMNSWLMTALKFVGFLILYTILFCFVMLAFLITTVFFIT